MDIVIAIVLTCLVVFAALAIGRWVLGLAGRAIGCMVSVIVGIGIIAVLYLIFF